MPIFLKPLTQCMIGVNMRLLDNVFQEKLERLRKSVWFKRSSTLQELLASLRAWITYWALLLYSFITSATSQSSITIVHNPERPMWLIPVGFPSGWHSSNLCSLTSPCQENPWRACWRISQIVVPWSTGGLASRYFK